MKPIQLWVTMSSRGYRAALLLLGVMSFVCAPGCSYEQFTCKEEGCDPEPDEPPPGVQACNLHTFDESPAGICIPHVDAGWHTALVRMVPRDAPQPRCPPSAAIVGLWGDEIVRYGAEPRRVIGCSVFPLATCASLNWACVPDEPDYPPCVVKDAQTECPAAYPLSTRVEPDGSAEPTLVCCAATPLPD